MTVKTAKHAFNELTRIRLAPTLRSMGFKGSGRNFVRVQGDTINALNIQGSRDGDQIAVNLGLHFAFLPALWADSPKAAESFKELECDLRCRLSPRPGYDHWWNYGLNEESAAAAVDSIVDTYVRFGEPLFLSFGTTFRILEAVSSETLNSGRLEHFPWRSTKPALALTLARICQHLGDSAGCTAYASAGLKNIGIATGLKGKLEELAHTT